MKRLILFTTSLIIFSALSAKPLLNFNTGSSYIAGTDTLELYDTVGNIINNLTVQVLGVDPNVDVMEGHIWFKNTTNTEMQNVKVRRIMNQEVTGTSNSFCFGRYCFPPNVSESPYPDTCLPGVVNKSFYSDYYPNPESTGGHAGLTSITYEFFDDVTFGYTVSAKTTIDFLVSGTSVNEDKLVIKGIYPNPAAQTASMEYNFPSSFGNVRLIVRNLLGVEVDNSAFESKSGKKSINVSSLASGIYFYSIVVDGKTVQTKKFIVKH